MDANSNALVDPGEIKPASAYLRELNVKPTLEGPDAYCVKGAILLDGTAVQTWDWWSKSVPALGYPRVSSGFKATASRVFVSPTPALAAVASVSVFRWVMTEGNQTSGLLRFIQVDGVTYVISSPMSADSDKGMLVPYAKVTASGSRLSWKFLADCDNTTERASVQVSDLGSTLLGENVCVRTWAPAPHDHLTYGWVAELVSADLLNSASDSLKQVYSSLCGFSEASFAKALRLNPRSVGSLYLPIAADVDVGVAVVGVPIVPFAPFVVSGVPVLPTKVGLPPRVQK